MRAEDGVYEQQEQTREVRPKRKAGMSVSKRRTQCALRGNKGGAVGGACDDGKGRVQGLSDNEQVTSL